MQAEENKEVHVEEEKEGVTFERLEALCKLVRSVADLKDRAEPLMI